MNIIIAEQSTYHALNEKGRPEARPLYHMQDEMTGEEFDLLCLSTAEHLMQMRTDFLKARHRRGAI